ncbi:unnamed protein product [Closterium sp. NIES-54]
MEGLPAPEWPEAASFPQPLITGHAVHSGDTDDIAKIPKEALEHLSIQDFVVDADAAIDKGPKEKQKDEAERHKYCQKTIGYRAEPETWHQRFGHPSHTTLKNSLRAGVFDDDALLLPRGGTLTSSVDPPCTVYPTASLAHKPFPDLPPGYKRYKPLNKVYSDFMILSQEGLDGEYYTLTFIDACTRYLQAINTDCRSLAFECFVAWMKRAERQSGLKLKTYQTDGALLAQCCAALQLLALPVPFTHHALLQPARHALQLRASRSAAACTSRPAAASASRPAALRVTPCCSQRVTPYCSQRVALCCPARRALLQPARRTLLQPACRALLSLASHPAAASASHPTAASASALLPHTSRPAALYSASPGALRPATAAATAARATAAGGGGAAGSAGSAAGAGGAGGATGSAGGAAGAGRVTRSAGGAAGAGGARPTTDHHCLSWPLSRQLQRLGEDSSGHCLSRTTPPLSSFASGFLSEPVQAAALGASESAAALGASESAAALGASESATTLGARASPATGPSSAEALHTFTLDSGASRCFFCDYTTLTPLAAPVPVSLADPTGGPVVARASTLLPCLAVPSSSLSSLHLPTFSMNLVSNAAIQDVWVDTFIPGGQHVAICTCSQTGRHLATFTRRPGSSLYTLTTASAQVAEVGQTLLWHHRLGHPSLPRLRGMHSRLLVSGLPRSLPSPPRSPAPPCLPCGEGKQRATPHSSEFPPTTAPLQTLHMDVWGPTPVSGTDQERYFLLVVEDYTRYTTVFPLGRKADVSGVLIPWIRATCHKGIHQSFTLPASPQQNGIVERCIDLIVEVARTSMIHVGAPHFLWPFAVRYAAHQLNLWPHVYEPETSPTLRWTGKVGDASVFRGPAPSGVSLVDPPPLVEP